MADRSLPTVSSHHAGFTAIELLFAVGMLVTIGGMAAPPILRSLDDYRATGAARYVAARLQRARMEAILRSADVAVRFVALPAGYAFAAYVDGNGDGVLSRDIATSVDQSLGPPERLIDTFTGVEFGAEAGLPPVDPGGSPPGADPIRLGTSNMASFSAMGTSSSGSLYIRSRTRQLVVRIYGDTGKTRILRFDPQARQWKPV